MKTLTVRQVEDRTADLLAQKAKSKGMSMEAQVRSILRETALEISRTLGSTEMANEMAATM